MYKKVSKQIITRLILLTAGILVLAAGAAYAQTAAARQDNSQVKVQIEAARAALKKKDFSGATRAYERAIELDPFNYEAHSGLLEVSSSRSMSELFVDGNLLADEKTRKEIYERIKSDKENSIRRYNELAAKYPEKAVFKLILAAIDPYEIDQVKNYLDQAYQAEPNNLDVLSNVAVFEISRGNGRRGSDLLRQISEQRPTDDDAAASYAMSLENVDDKLYREESLKFVKRFPNAERAPQVLSWLAESVNNDTEKLGYLEELKRSYPPAKFNWSLLSMNSLFTVYAKNDSVKALAFAREMVEIVATPAQKKDWQAYVDYQTGINQAATFLKEKKPAQTLELLEKIKIPRRYRDTSRLYILKAQALDANGQGNAAYELLLANVIKQPSIMLVQALDNQGRKLGKNKNQVKADLQASISAQTEPIKDFSLARFDNGRNVSLSDYRGKIVLLNFWYPMCGPCHQEAPYLQKLVEKYGKDKFVILSPSVHPKEDSLVVPYFENTKFDFVPLKVPSDDWAVKEYKVQGFPTNYLIDKQGRKVFELGVIYQARWEEVQLLIEMVMAQKQ